MKPIFSRPVSLSTYIFAWIAAAGFLLCLAWVTGAILLDAQSSRREMIVSAERIASVLAGLSEESFYANRWSEVEKTLNAMAAADPRILSTRVLDRTGAVVAACDRCREPSSGFSLQKSSLLVTRDIRSPNSGKTIGTLDVRFSGKEFGMAWRYRLFGYLGVFLAITAVMLAVVRLSVRIAIAPGIRMMEQVRRATLSNGEISLQGTGILELDEMGKTLEKSFRTLRKAQALLEDHVRSRAMSEMAFGVAHDFNNYLAAIVANRERVEGLLLEEPLPRDRIREALAAIEQAAQEAEALIRKVFLLGRHPEEAPARTLFRADSLVSEAVSILEGKWKIGAARRGIRYSVHTAAEPIEASGVPSDLRTVLFNLLANALDAMPSGGALDVGVFRAGDSITFFVEDTGPGVPEDLREKIFDPFFTTKAPHGTGLGLAIVKRVAAAHGGTVSCLPRRDGSGGTRFELTIPLLRAEVPAAPPPDAAPDEEALPAWEILLVDDDELVREAMANILRHLGQRVDLFSNGLEAVAAFERKRYPVVVSDIGMTPINGFEVARRVRAMSTETTIVLVSGWTMEAEELRKETIVNHFLPKPFRLNDVREVLRKISRERGE